MDDVWNWHILPHAGPIRGFSSDPQLVAALRLQRFWRRSRVLAYKEGLNCIAWVRHEYKQPVVLRKLSTVWVAARSKGSFWFLPNEHIVLLI